MSGFTALALALAACGSDDADHEPAPDAGASTSVETPIDPSTGGKVELAGGPSLDFPADALPEGSAVEIRVAVSESDGPAGTVSPVWEFGPAGTTFSKPVAVELPFELGDKDPNDYTIAWTKLGSDEFEDVATTFESGKALALVTHFSRGCVHKKQAPDKPAPVTCDEDTATARDTDDDGVADKCECKLGFKEQDSQCVDIDECDDNHGGCSLDVSCTNTVGSFECGNCGEGYTGGGEAGCTDIDECATNNGDCGAHKQCTNTPGSHECGGCDSGFKASGADCVDIDECATDNGGCGAHRICTNKVGSRACGGCTSGYTLDGDACVDIDECATDNGGCGAHKVCTNEVGSRECGGCENGYKLEGDACVDVDECATNNGGCGENKVCMNSAGSFMCGDSCVLGYTTQESDAGTICVDVDECAAPSSPCTGGSLCTNQIGGYACSAECPDGYTAKDSVCKRVGNSLLDFAIATKQDATGADFIHAPNIASTTDIDLTVPAGSDLTQLWVAIVSSEGSQVAATNADAQSVPADGGPLDFSQEVTYTVTAEDGGTRTYKVHVHIADATELAAVSINGYWGTIRGQVITVSIPENTDGFDFNLTPVFTTAPGASVTPSGAVAFTNGVAQAFTVSSSGFPDSTYHLTVNVGTDLSSAKDITAFNVTGQEQATIDTAASTVLVSVPFGTPVTNVSTTFSLSEGASAWPLSGTTLSFELDVAMPFYVIAQDGTVKTYQVTVHSLPQAAD